MFRIEVYWWILWIWLAIAPVTFISLFFITAPYGRHVREGWGKLLHPTLAWILMELPAFSLPIIFFIIGGRFSDPAAWVFLGLFELHYINRTWIFPFRLPKNAKPMPLSISLSGFSFNLVNGYLIGVYLFVLGPQRGAEWFADPRFIAGAALFLFGYFINLQSDSILRGLRKPGQTGYKIPTGGLYRWITSPNYFGEIMEWSGFALLTWSMPGLCFLAWSIANLVPRAISHHKWYLEKFEDYPKNRKAWLPFIW